MEGKDLKASDAVDEELYIPMQDATELVGCFPRYFSRLAKHGIVKIKRVGISRYIRWSDLKTVVEIMDSPFRLVGKKMLELEKLPQDLLLSTEMMSKIGKNKETRYETTSFGNMMLEYVGAILKAVRLT